MNINSKFFKIIVLLISLTYVQGIFNPTKCICRLVTYIKKDSKVFRIVVLLHESIGGKKALLAKDIVSNIAGSVPTELINLDKLNSTKVQDLVNAGDITQLRATTLFVTIQSLDSKQYSSQTNDMDKILNQVMGKKGRPKCLMIFLSQEKWPSYIKLLQSLWLANFLDVSVLELIDIEVPIKNWFAINHQHLGTVHQFNPFTKIYTEEKCSANTHFFHDKLRDLNGYDLKTGSFDEPPVNHVKRNRSGYPIEVTGTGAEVVKALSKAMNCSILEIESKHEGWGDWSKDLIINSTLPYQITHNKMQFYTNFGEYTMRGNESLDFSRASDEFCYYPVVPILKSKTVSVQYSRKCLYMAVSMFVMMLIPFIVGYILKSESRVWSPLYILEAALGLSIPPMPQKSAEQIIFFFEVFAFLISSSVIYAVLTDIKLTTESEMEINTLEDLNNSRLQLVMRKSTSFVMRSGVNEEIADVLLNKTIIVSSDKRCIKLLIMHKNITCIMAESKAKSYVQEYDKLHASFKIGKTCLRKGLQVMVLEPGSPYIRRIDQILAQLIQSGLFVKWKQDHSVNPPSNAINEIIQDFIQTTDIMVPLLLTMIVGFSISVIVFASELILHYLFKYLKWANGAQKLIGESIK